MPIGIIINTAAVVFGSLSGSTLKCILPENNKQTMNWILGICAMGMGISSIFVMKNMPAVIFSIIAGTLLGTLLKLSSLFQKAVNAVLSHLIRDTNDTHTEIMLTAIILFCTSATGIYGALDAGMTGNHSILIAKAVLDFFTAMIFACQLGKALAFVAIPQFAILTILFLLSEIILPMTSEIMIQDFKACGGFLLLATGLRMMQLRAFPITDMIPAMVLVMPFSYCWTSWFLPFFT